jgi:hypothetical protein
MKQSVKFYLSRFNESAKYIKQMPNSCEIVQIKNGDKVAEYFSAPYPAGDEDLIEVPAHEYYAYLKGAKQIYSSI